MSYPTKSEREMCWRARDRYWECLDKNNENDSVCAKWREGFEKDCSAVWVKHFDKKRKYEKFKEHMDNVGWQLTNEEDNKKK